MTAFQSTRPRGARLEDGELYDGACQFQSTRPRGARQPFSLQPYIDGEFQSTRPRGARQRYGGKDRQRFCFNPRARVGRDRLLDNWLIIKDKVNAFCEHYKK